MSLVLGSCENSRLYKRVNPDSWQYEANYKGQKGGTPCDNYIDDFEYLEHTQTHQLPNGGVNLVTPTQTVVERNTLSVHGNNGILSGVI